MIGLEANINVWSNSKANKSTCAASAWSMSHEPSAAILRGTRLLPIRNTGSMARLLPICTPGSMAPPVHPIRTTDRRSNSTQHCAAVLWVPLRPSRLSSAAAHVPWFRPLCPGVLTPPGAGSVWRCWAAVLCIIGRGGLGVHAGLLWPLPELGWPGAPDTTPPLWCPRRSRRSGGPGGPPGRGPASDAVVGSPRVGRRSPRRAAHVLRGRAAWPP